MIKFTAERDGNPLLGLGITGENVRRLMLGKPILVRLADVGCESDKLKEVAIFFGPTEQTIVADLVKAGLIKPDCQINLGD